MKAAITFAPVSTKTHSLAPAPHAFVSIIVPTFNEAPNICRQAQTLRQLPNVEIIFADGGSSDGTAKVISSILPELPNAHLIQTSCGRPRQMNAGAKHAKGEWLIFLHADTVLPEDSFGVFLKTIHESPGLNSGAFTFRVEHEKWAYRYLEFYVGLRCKFLKLPFGDQALFIKRRFFEALGGYRADFPLMEDMELVQRLNKQAGFAILPAPVFTSPRRYEHDGFFKRGLGNIYLQLLYRCGVHPRELAKKYYPRNGSVVG
jgi:rSAM/selenodomain-associated transferase 2